MALKTSKDSNNVVSSEWEQLYKHEGSHLYLYCRINYINKFYIINSTISNYKHGDKYLNSNIRKCLTYKTGEKIGYTYEIKYVTSHTP